MKKQSSWLVTALAIGAPLLAAAQANPADPASMAPPLRFQSAFSDYKPWQDIPPGDWRALNESVRGTGDHAEQDSAPAAAPTPNKPAAAPAGSGLPAPDGSGHGGHPSHGGQQ